MFGMRVCIDCVLFLPVYARHGDNQGRSRAQRVHNIKQHIVAQQPGQFDMKRIGQAVPTHAVAFSGCLLFALYHRIKRFE